MSLELNNLSIGYTTGKAVAAAITATAAEGRLTCLLGANGMGKSTLLRTMAGFMPPLGGSIAINGTDTSRQPAHRMARQVSVVLTLPSATGNLSVREMVAMGRTPYTNFWVDEALSMAGIAHLADRKLYAVSDGERQKAMIAKSLAQQTPVLLLDEPTAFLDYPSRAELMAMLGKLAREEQKTVLVSTHDIELALHTADDIWLLDGGTLTAAPAQDPEMASLIARKLNYRTGDSRNLSAQKP